MRMSRMKANIITTTTRREFLKTTGQITAVSALAGMTLPHVYAQGSDQLRIAQNVLDRLAQLGRDIG